MLSPSEISVIIPVYNGGALFERCLEALSAIKSDYHEIIVVADGDTDGSWQKAQAFGAKVIRLPSSGGPARARNIGADAATGKVLFFTDADVAIHADTLAKVAQAFNQNPALAALIGSYDDEPGDFRFLSQYRNLLHHYTHQTSKADANTFWGACGAIRADVFQQMGGFSVAYRRPTIEDIELGYRLRAAGHQIALCRDVQVKHLKRWTASSMLKADFFYRALPWTELILREQRLDNDLNLSMASRLSVGLSYVLLLSLAIMPLTTTLGRVWLTVNLLIATVWIGGLLQLNFSLYRFFYIKRGLGFALRSVPWHWLYYLYSGLAFVIGTLRHWLRQQKRPSIKSLEA
ncbi:MAG: glycosyltransferase family 2 protein [Leptolyngbya sp. SIO4C1]|nr:glycosyltransferase family 2 protein [Leptolyngbya sp. SIO4C1]